MIDWQDAAAIVVALVCAGYMLRTFLQPFRARLGDACHGCGLACGPVRKRVKTSGCHRPS